MKWRGKARRNYCVARKGLKVYMTNPLEVTVKSITTENVQKLLSF